jgi:hypothetical protein
MVPRHLQAVVAPDPLGQCVAVHARHVGRVRHRLRLDGGVDGHPLEVLRLGGEARLLAQAPKFEAGQVLLPKDASWLATYISELLAFPNGTHDDQVDSTSQALGWLSRRIAIGTPPIRPDPKRPVGSPRR